MMTAIEYLEARELLCKYYLIAEDLCGYKCPFYEAGGYCIEKDPEKYEVAISVLEKWLKDHENNLKLKVPKYKKNPIEVEAIQYTGYNLNVLKAFIGDSLTIVYTGTTLTIKRPALEGSMEVSVGDYVIKDVNGKFYPCKSDEFEKSYTKIIDSEEVIKEPLPCLYQGWALDVIDGLVCLIDNYCSFYNCAVTDYNCLGCPSYDPCTTERG